MDTAAQQSASPPNPPPFLPGVFAYDNAVHGNARLLGGHCPQCRRHYFPRPRYCPQCLGPVNEAALSSRGRIYSYTVVRTKAPWGLPEPYGVGYVDLPENDLRVFCLLDPGALDRLRVGLEVSLSAAPLGLGLDGKPCVRPYFSPVQRERG